MTEEQRNSRENLPDDETRLIDEAADAIEDMEAREARRDGKHDTGGDDRSPGIDTTIDANAPKELNLPPDERGGSHG